MSKLPWSPLPERPLVSIITTNLNYGTYLEDTILSVLRQDYESIELVIIDGASTDNSLDVIRKYAGDPRVRWVSEPDHGHMDAVNKGIELACGEIIGLQHSTDTYQPGAIREAVTEFGKDPALAFVGGGAQWIDEYGLTTGEAQMFSAKDIPVEDIIGFVEYPPVQASFMRRDVLRSIGGFVHSCHTNTFLRYMLEAWKLGGKSKRIPGIWGNYRQHSHAIREDYRLYKGLAYAEQRRQAVELNDDLYGACLTPHQLTILRRSSYEYELRYRICFLRQTLGALPCLIKYLSFGGRMAFVLQQYRALLVRLAKRVFHAGRQGRAQTGSSARWYLPTSEMI